MDGQKNERCLKQGGAGSLRNLSLNKLKLGG